MELFGMGPGEIMLVLILALIVFGPAKLPEMARGLGRAVREFQKATSQITEELTRELQTDTPAQEAPRPQPPAPQEPRQEEPAAAVEAQTGPLVLEIKPPAPNGAATVQQDVTATIQAAPTEAPAAEAPAAEAAPKSARARRTRKKAVEPAAETEAIPTEAVLAEAAAVTAPSAETTPAAKPRRRRKAPEAVEAGSGLEEQAAIGE